MGFIQDFVEIILHLDKHLFDLCTAYGAWVYAILFVVVFCETGLVVTPFLPGDSLLFAVGSLAAINALDFTTSVGLLILAAVLGDNQAGSLRTPVLGRKQGEGLAVDAAGALGLVAHQRDKAVDIARREDVGRLDAKALQLVERQVEAAAARIVTDIADDIDQLQCQSHFRRIDEGRGLAVTKDRRRHLADNAGDKVRVALQPRVVQVAVLPQVHLHAVEDRGQTHARDAEGTVAEGLQRAGYGVRRSPVVERIHLAAPPGELGLGHGGVAHLVDDDRISHEIPYYRTYLKNAVLQGTIVVNNPFWWSADDKFFGACLLDKLGIKHAKTVALPSHSYVDGVVTESLRNLTYPVP